ncbi:MAG: hypothetical protein NTX09_16560 [Verrucomicrobia bacterium]|jgi:hypothetical protein|nr:hypothetical protein [Verrucomicrobiota bacterium]
MPTLPAFSPALLFHKEAKAVHDALAASGHHALASMIASKARRSETDRQFIAALPRLDDSDFDVDDEPVVSASEDGAYVMVWRWVANEEAGVAVEA